MTMIVTRFLVHGLGDDTQDAVREAIRKAHPDLGTGFPGEGLVAVRGDVDPQSVCATLAEAGFPAVVMSG